MAREYFVGWSIDDKIRMLQGLQEAMLTGMVVRVSTARGVETQFDPREGTTALRLERLEYSIWLDATPSQLDPQGIIRAGCARNQRTLQSRPFFY